MNDTQGRQSRCCDSMCTCKASFGGISIYCMLLDHRRDKLGQCRLIRSQPMMSSCLIVCAISCVAYGYKPPEDYEVCNPYAPNLRVKHPSNRGHRDCTLSL